MTELELYKFIKEYDCETSFHGDSGIIWISHYFIDEFCELLGHDFLSDGGIEVRLQQNCVAIDLDEICEYFDIDVKNIIEAE